MAYITQRHWSNFNWFMVPTALLWRGFSINELETEIKKKTATVIGTLIFGDMNVHHKAWSYHSNGTAPEGTALFKVCAKHALQQLVRHPTRDQYLLDLMLSDLSQLVKIKVLSKISDHNMVFIE